ncbi:hypothetical protein BJ878DRAFT_479690 [Calycina marina]|uniref:JmjC domain-containing protein n=1 Tax=Calycina marina TaxID=1763456 RepID=A0A9P7Z4V3_9HELO|nr:hypothetical protein BJ878DRAFT_479690 [Calycina marina]
MATSPASHVGYEHPYHHYQSFQHWPSQVNQSKDFMPYPQMDPKHATTTPYSTIQLPVVMSQNASTRHQKEEVHEVREFGGQPYTMSWRPQKTGHKRIKIVDYNGACSDFIPGGEVEEEDLHRHMANMRGTDLEGRPRLDFLAEVAMSKYSLAISKLDTPARLAIFSDETEASEFNSPITPNPVDITKKQPIFPTNIRASTKLQHIAASPLHYSRNNYGQDQARLHEADASEFNPPVAPESVDTTKAKPFESVQLSHSTELDVPALSIPVVKKLADSAVPILSIPVSKRSLASTATILPVPEDSAESVETVLNTLQPKQPESATPILSMPDPSLSLVQPILEKLRCMAKRSSLRRSTALKTRSPSPVLPALVRSTSSEPSISSSPGPLTPLSYSRKRSFDQLYCPESPPKSDFYFEINSQQTRLCRDDSRVLRQIFRFKEAQEKESETYYGAFAPIGLHILEKGRPAQTSTDQNEADFLVGNSKDLENWLVSGTGDKMFLLRDHQWVYTRPESYGSTILEELKSCGIENKEMRIEVQHLGKKLGKKDDRSVSQTLIDDVIRAFADKSGAPINLLSLQCRADGTVPWPLAKHCNLLNQAAASSAALAQTAFYAAASKQPNEVMTKVVDLQSCMHFMIYGQAGAISSWHMDSIGPYTYVTLEPNAKGEASEDVLKLWAYVRTNNLSPKEQAEIKDEFQRTGLAYKPNPEHIRILALTAGDTLIMPPGTIHAPITITDCLFRGGMVMQKKEMRRSIREWKFCAENDICTNEDQPKQARSILDYFRRLARTDPASCGYGGPEGLAEFEGDCKSVGGASMSCKCSGGCNQKKRCHCASNTQRCGAACHKGLPRCQNPYGCEADVL